MTLLGSEGVEASLLSLHASTMKRDFRRDALFKWVEQHLPKTGRCLDVGCGTGFVTERLARTGLDVVGIEKSEVLFTFARGRLERKGMDAELVLGDVAEAPEYGPFDAIVCLDVIEHIKDDQRALLALREACQPEGRLVLSVPSLSRLYGARDRRLGHFRRYDKDELVGKVEKSGFLVEVCQFWNLLGVFPYWFSERLLGHQVDDRLRTGQDSWAKHIIRQVIEMELTLEARCSFLPLGLSLVCVSRAI